MKRFGIVLIMLCIIPVLMFSAGSKETASSTAKADEPVVITALFDNGQPLNGFNAVAKVAEKRFNIKFEIEIRPGGNEGENIVKTRLATGDMADLCMYNSGSLFQALNPSEFFVDLADEPFMDSLDETYKNTVSENGNIYGVPCSSTQAGAWLYNKKIYADLGLKVPSTWAELIANAKKIKAAGIDPIIGSYKDAWTSQLIFLGDHYNVLQQYPNFPEEYTAGKAKYASNKAALRSWEKLYESNAYMNKDYLATTYDMALEMLVEGKGAMYPIITQALSYIFEIYPDEIENIGVFGQPGDSGASGLTVWMSSSFYVNKTSKNIDKIKEFLDFYVSEEAVGIYSKEIKPDGPYAIKGIALPEGTYAGVLEMVPYFDAGRTAPALEFQSPVKGSSAEQITVQCGANLKSAIECADSYDKDVRKQAIQLGLPGWN
ncbi:MAG: carbohydrate ABC transporter substrate-binding protein [Sphaerochaeta sp.]|nr:carbohydrate ABC transporter substrate-binding protein [Sphaerochaeta sp.]